MDGLLLPRTRVPWSWIRPILCGLALFTIPHTCHAELLYFQGGGALQAPAEITDQDVRIRTGYGTYLFPRQAFRAIVPGYDSARAWPERWKEASCKDVEARLSAIWWAVENGLTDEASRALVETQRDSPRNDQANRLARLVSSLDRPLNESPRVREIRPLFPVSLERLDSTHFTLLHQQDSDTAWRRLRMLEQVFTAYYLSLAFQGLELPLPAEKLVSVHLGEPSDYRHFLETQNASAFRGTQGFYHPTFQIVVAYDIRREKGNTPVRLPPDDPKALLALDRLASFDLGTACHETVHQLVRASRLDGEPRKLPIWFHEGFAAQFEVIRAGHWAGLSRAHDLRLSDYRALTDPPQLLSLLQDRGFGQGYRGDRYAAAWSLVYYLRKTHPSEFLAFLDLLRNPASEEPSTPGDRTVAAFQNVFGPDLKPLESDWHHALATCRTPTQSHDPTP